MTRSHERSTAARTSSAPPVVNKTRSKNPNRGNSSADNDLAVGLANVGMANVGCCRISLKEATATTTPQAIPKRNRHHKAVVVARANVEDRGYTNRHS